MYEDPNQPPQQKPFKMPPTQYAPPPYNPPQYGASPYNPMQYGAPPVPGYSQFPQKPKRSRCRLWITLSIVGGVLLLICAGFVAYVATTGGASGTASSYYQAIENHDYAKAYGYLGQYNQTPTEAIFIQEAQAKDATDGPVTNFSQTSYNDFYGIVDITMSVTRNGQPYDAQLQLRQDSNGNWFLSQWDI